MPMVDHCDIPMMLVYEHTDTEDRYDLALTVEIVKSLHQCINCGAKLSTELQQPKMAAVDRGE